MVGITESIDELFCIDENLLYTKETLLQLSMESESFLADGLGCPKLIQKAKAKAETNPVRAPLKEKDI